MFERKTLEQGLQLGEDTLGEDDGEEEVEDEDVEEGGMEQKDVEEGNVAGVGEEESEMEFELGEVGARDFLTAVIFVPSSSTRSPLRMLLDGTRMVFVVFNRMELADLGAIFVYLVMCSLLYLAMLVLCCAFM